jgi:hypothetical protein
MKLIRIEGKIWELSILWDDKYAESENDESTLHEKNMRAIQGKGWFRGIVRVLAGNAVKSKAMAVIETTVNGLPHQMSYEIYHNSKGFFCKVQKQRVFLNDLVVK